LYPYRRLLMLYLKVVAAGLVFVSVIISFCIVFDWGSQVGWGYPWWSLPLVIVIGSCGMLIWRVATSQLRSMSR
jgi:hypothetical protein